MSHVVRIPSNVYKRLEKHAEGFDTPVNVIEKLLNHYEGVEQSPPRAATTQTDFHRDRTQYVFNDKTHGKGRLVLAVVQQYVADNPGVSYDELTEVFPRRLQGSIGVINKHAEVEEKYRDKPHKRHFLKDDAIIRLSDIDGAVCTEWGAGNIDNFIQAAESLGYSILPVVG